MLIIIYALSLVDRLHILIFILFSVLFVPVELSSSKSTLASADGASLSDFKSKNTKIN